MYPRTGVPATPPKIGNGPIILAVVLILIAIFLTADSLSDVATGLASRRWPSADGQLVDAYTIGSPYRSRRYRRRVNIHVRYRYSVDGKEYSSETYGIGRWRWRSYSSAEAALNRVRSSPLRVFYDPASPRRSVVRTGTSFDEAFRLLLGLTTLGAGILALVKPEVARRLGSSLAGIVKNRAKRIRF